MNHKNQCIGLFLCNDSLLKMGLKWTLSIIWSGGISTPANLQIVPRKSVLEKGVSLIWLGAI